MPDLPKPFPVADWNLMPEHYPSVIIVDKAWAQDLLLAHEPRSRITAPLEGVTPLDTISQTEHHGEKTLHVIRSVAKGLRDENILRVSMDRRNVIDNFSQHLGNLPEALLSIQPRIKKGDLIVINLGANSGKDSFASDSLIGRLLEDIITVQGGIVVISAGNISESTDITFTSDVIVVGGVGADAVASSRFGSSITCYGVVPYALPELLAYPEPVFFQNSSAATAFTAGLVLMMLNYANSLKIRLISKQVVGLLKANSNVFKVLTNTGSPLAVGNIPDLTKLRKAIEILAHPNPE